MIQPREGLALSAARTRLRERRFAGASRVDVRKLHGGLSGSIVLRTDPYDADGKPEEPTVTKIDSAANLVQEVRETTFIARLGADAVRVLRGPVFSEEQAPHVLAFAEAKLAGPLRERQLAGSIALLRCAWLLSAASAALLVGALARARLGGQTGDILGASQQCAEIAILLVLLAL